MLLVFFAIYNFEGDFKFIEEYIPHFGFRLGKRIAPKPIGFYFRRMGLGFPQNLMLRKYATPSKHLQEMLAPSVYVAAVLLNDSVSILALAHLCIFLTRCFPKR